jgi:Fe-S-cluster containining protein
MSKKQTSTESELLSEDGNRAYCNYCPGLCCYRLPGASLLITAIDINRIARHFCISDGEVRKRYMEGKNTFKVKDDGSCVFLANGRLNRRCTIHLARPQQCREFPYGEPCPYLHRKDLLEVIYPRFEKSFHDPDGLDDAGENRE